MIMRSSHKLCRTKVRSITDRVLIDHTISFGHFIYNPYRNLHMPSVLPLAAITEATVPTTTTYITTILEVTTNITQSQSNGLRE